MGVKISELSDSGWTKITLWKLQLVYMAAERADCFDRLVTHWSDIWTICMLRLGGMANADIWGDNSLTLFPLTFLLKFDKGHLSEVHKSTYRWRKKTVKEFIFFMWEKLFVSLKPLLHSPRGEVAGTFVLSRLSHIFSFSLNLCLVPSKLEDNSTYYFIYLVFRNNSLWRFHYLFFLLLSVAQWSAACQELCFSKPVIPFPTAFSQR